MRGILALSILTYSSTAFGQFSTNDLMLSGTVSLNSESNPHSTTGNSTERIYSIGIGPSVGAFISKNLEIGGQFGYSKVKREEHVQSMNLEFETTLLSAGIYGQRYFTLLNKFYFTILTSVTFSSGNDNFISKFPIPANITTQQSKIFQFTTLIRPTIVFFPLRTFGIQMSIGSIRYLYSKNVSTKDRQSDVDVSYWPTTIGLTYYLDR